jgi:hypothetical protein
MWLLGTLYDQFKSYVKFMQAFVWDVIAPTSRLRSRWDMWMLLLLVYVCLTAPYLISFNISYPRASALGVWETIVNGCFALDIYFNFRTAYMGNSQRPASCLTSLTNSKYIVSELFANKLWCRSSIRYSQLDTTQAGCKSLASLSVARMPTICCQKCLQNCLTALSVSGAHCHACVQATVPLMLSRLHYTY